MLLKVNATSSSRSEIVELAQIFRARVVDVAEDALTLGWSAIRAKWSLCRCCKIWSARSCPYRKIALTHESGEYRVAQVQRQKFSYLCTSKCLFATPQRAIAAISSETLSGLSLAVKSLKACYTGLRGTTQDFFTVVKPVVTFCRHTKRGKVNFHADIDAAALWYLRDLPHRIIDIKHHTSASRPR